MKPRLLILVAVAAGMAIYWATRAAAPPVPLDLIPGPSVDPDVQKDYRDMELRGCVEPDEDADLRLVHDVDSTGRKNRIFFTIAESNDLFVAGFELELWYKEHPDQDYDDSPFKLTEYVEDFVRSGETLEGCLELNAGEMTSLPGQVMGTIDNWEVEVIDWHRVCETDPVPLPPRKRVHTCD